MSEFADFSNTERSKGMIKILNTVLGEAVTWCPDKVCSSSQLLIDTRREGVTCAEVQLEE
jgi:hypothetical protein